MRGMRINFFCCRADLRIIVENIEKSLNLKYIPSGIYSSIHDIRPYSSLLDYADLGIKKSGEHQSEFFLVAEAISEITFDKCHKIDGSVQYSVNQLCNPDSIVLYPGGIYMGNFLIHGQVSTIGTGYNAQKLMKVFRKEIKRQCPKKNHVFYFSEGVEHLYNSGVRLITINVNEPVEYDLKI